MWNTWIAGYVNKVIKRAYDEVEQIITTECQFTLVAHAQLVGVINFEKESKSVIQGANG